MEYTYIKPEYKQGINQDIEIELFRYSLIKDYVARINKELKSRYAPKQQTYRQYRKTAIYIAQLIMNVNTNNSYSVNHSRQPNRKIIVEDNLFIRVPTKEEVVGFYRDINYTYDIPNFVSTDEFAIRDTIADFIKQTTEFIDNINKLNTKKTNQNRKFNVITKQEYLLYRINNPIAKKYGLKAKKQYYKLDKRIFTKLKAEYKGPSNQIHNLILCALLRYDTLGSEANQFVHNLDYKELLRKEVGADFECFASMFNHYYSGYCSMFYDIEGLFGSSGSFFGLTMKKGCFHVNPPYDENLLDKMGKHIKANIKPGVIINAALPKWKDFVVEDDFDKGALAKFIIADKFMNPYTFKYVDIPPYIMYLYADVEPEKIDYSYVNKIKKGKYKKIQVVNIELKSYNKKSGNLEEDIKRVNTYLKLIAKYYTSNEKHKVMMINAGINNKTIRQTKKNTNKQTKKTNKQTKKNKKEN
jgi:hypothetical protein